MWVPPADLRDLGTALQDAHRALVDPVPAAAQAVVAADWRCGAGDELRRQVSVLLRRVADAGGVIAAGRGAADHLAGEAEALLTAMHRARQERVEGLEQSIRETIADGDSPGTIRAELDDVPGVPDLAWLPSVPDPVRPVFVVPEASAVLPPVTSPGGAFHVELEQLDLLPAALEDVAAAVGTARGAHGTVEATRLTDTDLWGLGGGVLVGPLDRAFGLVGLAYAGVQLDGVAAATRVAAARIRRANTEDNLLRMFDGPEGFTTIADELLALRLSQQTPSIDLEARRAELQLAHDAGLAPHLYDQTLRDYWFLTAAAEAGIDVDSWDIGNGAFANAETIEEVYAYYGRLFLENPELQWAGLANMVGAGFAAAFYDLDLYGQISDGASRIPNSPVGPIGQLSEAELRHYETMFLSMQRQIFEDIGGMHQAYVGGGMSAIDELRDAGIMDRDTYRAFVDIDRYSQMDPDDPVAQQLIHDANYALAFREQGAVIGDDYDDMRNHFPSGPGFTYIAGLVGTPSVPGAQSPAQYDPLIIRDVPISEGRVGLPDIPFADVPFWDDAHVDVYTVEADVTTPLPRTNISVFDDRMDLLREDTLPAYERLLAERGADGLVADGLVSDDPADVATRIDEYRLHHRMDETLEQLANWDVDVDARWGG